MEIPSAKNNTIAFLLLGLIHVLLIQLWTRINSMEKIFSKFWFDYSRVRSFDEKKTQNQVPLSYHRKSNDEGSISREEVEMVMEKLGLGCNPGSEEIFGFDSFSNLFEEKQPSLEEVKQAFDVFDMNRDGFIDEEELHRILSILGFKEWRELVNCQKMIKFVDQNGDGKIDFHEFVTLMENSLC